MDTIVTAMNDLGQAFEHFKQDQENKLNLLERKALQRNRYDTLNEKGRDNPSMNAFKTYLRKGDDRPLLEITQKALSSVDEDGGYLIPQVVESRLHQHVEDYSPIRRLSNVVTISSRSLELLLDQRGPDAGWVQETQARDETETPQLRKVTIPAHELYAKPKVTERLLSDTVTSVEDWLAQSVAKKMAQIENHAFIYGDGNHKPTGFLSYETVIHADMEWGKLEHILTGADNNFVDDSAPDKLLETMGSLKSIYLKDAVWVMSRPAFIKIQQQRDGEGKFIINPGHIHERRPLLFGYPVEIVEDMPGFVPGTACAVAFGNFKEAYQIVEHEGTHILRDPYSSKPFVEFYTTRRVGGDVINFDAIKILKFQA